MKKLIALCLCLLWAAGAVRAQTQQTQGPGVPAQNFPGAGSSSFVPTKLGCSAFSGATDDLVISACLTALHAASGGGGGTADASALICNGPWLTDPTQTSGGGVINILMPACTEQTNVPIDPPNQVNMIGVAPRPVIAQQGSILKAGSGFPATYSTGTVSVGTAGNGDVITGTSTLWTATNIARGCFFIAPAGGNTGNETYGVIQSVSVVAQTLTMYGINRGSGAGSGATYDIYCPVFIHGDGNTTSASYGISTQNMNFDCNSVAGCIPEADWYGQQGVYGVNNRESGFTNIGLDFETTNAQNSGPWDKITVSPSASCTANTIPVFISTAASPFFGISNITLSSGDCGTNPSVGIDVQGDNVRIDNVDVEHVTTGISANVIGTCPVACTIGSGLVNGLYVNGVHNPSGSGTTVVAIGNNAGTNGDVTVLGAYGTVTNVLTDAVNLCTDTDTRLGAYFLNHNGNIAYSTSPLGVCQPGISSTIVTKAATYSAAGSDHTILCNGTFTITLPTAGIPAGKEYLIKNINASATCTVSAGGTVNIDGATTFTITTQYASQKVQWDGTQWWKVD